MNTPPDATSPCFHFVRRCIGGLAAVATLSLSSVASAAMLAADNASNAAYASGGFAGANGGTGFAAWNAYGNTGTGGFEGNYVGGTGLDNNAGRSFGIYAGDVGSGASSNAVRPFNGALTAGQTFSVSLGNTTIGSGGLIGLSLQNSSFTTEVNLQTDGTSWVLSAGGANITLSADTIDTPFVFTLKYNGGSSYSYTFTGTTGGTNLTATNTLSDISQVNFFDFQQGANQNFGFNNLAVVPEPSSIALIALGLTGVVVSRRRRH